MKNPRLIDLSGQRFGRWLVVGRAGNTSGGGALWACVCDCGGMGVPAGTDLRNGKSTRCKTCVARESMLTHGGSGTRLHRIWKAMRNRCNNPKATGFALYGGRGIGVCAEWDDFATFRRWAESAGYSDALSIERKDTDAGYSPDNCKWATALEQSVNRRFVLKDGSGNAWSQIAKGNGIPVTLMHSRIHEGWPIESAATLPKGSRLR
jgi:hypothetical protein